VVSLVSLRASFAVRPNRALLRELGLVTAVLGALALWQRVVRAAADSLVPSLDSLSIPAAFVAGGVATGGLFVVGVALLVRAYATRRGVAAGFALPPGEGLRPLALAVLAPAALVCVTALVGAVTGVPYGSLTRTYYGPSPSLVPTLATVGLHVAVLVPCLTLVCQGVVQGSLGRVFDGPRAVVATTLVAGFALTSGVGGLTAVPDAGKLVGAVAFLALLAVGLAASERVDDRRLRRLAFLPALAFVAVTVAAGLGGVGSLAGGLFALTHLVVLGVAAHAYDRTETLLVPAAAYLCLSLSNAAVVVAEGGAAPPF
jgi:hypothetical protein